MEIVLSFLLSVMAEVVSHLICKWLETSPSALGDPPREALTPFLEEMVVGLVQRQSGQAKLDKVNVITSLNKKPGAATPGFFVSTWTDYNILLS